jgi:hypothetical protein
VGVMPATACSAWCSSAHSCCILIVCGDAHGSTRPCSPLALGSPNRSKNALSAGRLAASTRIDLTFQKVPDNRKKCRMWPRAGQAFFDPSGVCDRADNRSLADQTAKPKHSGPTSMLFRAADRLVLPPVLSSGDDNCHAQSDGVLRRRMAERTARTIGRVTTMSTR